jgi:hypothetical protein
MYLHVHVTISSVATTCGNIWGSVLSNKGGALKKMGGVFNKKGGVLNNAPFLLFSFRIPNLSMSPRMYFWLEAAVAERERSSA